MVERVSHQRTSRIRCALLAASTLTATLLIATAPEAAAIDGVGWSLAPTAAPGSPVRADLQYQVSAGQVVHDSVTLTNEGATARHYDIYAADAYNIPNGGAFALRGEKDPRTGAGSWISVPVHTLTVPPRTVAKIPVTIAVPAEVAPGATAAGVVALDTDPASFQQQGQVRIAVRQALGVRIYLQVGGPALPALAVTDVSIRRPGFGPAAWGGGHATVSYVVLDNGNTRLDAVVHARVVDELGRTVKRFPAVSLATLLPGSRVRVSEPWSAPRIGHFRVEVTVTSGATTATASASIWMIPWLLALGLLLIVAALLFRRRVRSRRGNPPPPPALDPPVDRDPALAAIDA